MTAAAPAPADAPSPDDALGGAGRWARPMMEEDLAALARVRDAAVAVTEALAALVQAQVQTQAQTQPRPEAPPPAPSPDPSAAPSPTIAAAAIAVAKGDVVLAFHRAARAVRMTCALRARLIQEIDSLDDDQARRAAHRLDEARDARRTQLAGVLTRIIEDAASLQAAEAADAAHDARGEGRERRETESEFRERLFEETAERLDDSDVYGDLLARPISEIIALICRDLGLAPEWPRLAEEAWAQDEIASGKVGAPLRTPPSPSRGEGSGMGVSARQAKARAARPREKTKVASPADQPPAEPPLRPDPEPAPPDPIVGLPGEYPPERPPRPKPPNVLSPDWGWTPTRS